MLVVEHDRDVISIADYVIDVGPQAGKDGGQIMFAGNYSDLEHSDTTTGKALRSFVPLNDNPRKPNGSLLIRGANLHNLKNIDVDIPLGIMTVITGVAGSGKSTLVSQCFAKQYEEQVVMIDQSPITATNRSTPASYLGFFDDLRKLLARENGKDHGLFSFNSKGACPVCGGKGVIVTELAFMDPVITGCEACSGMRYNQEALSCTYKGKNIVEILALTATEAEFFDDSKIRRQLKVMQQVGLSYLTLGQALSTLSGGERQHSSKTIIMRDNYVLALQQAHQRKIHAVGLLVYGDDCAITVIELMGGINEHCDGNSLFFRQPDDNLLHRTGIGVN